MIAKGQAKVHADLDKMPFVCDTYGLRTRHETLTQQLQQLDTRLKIADRKATTGRMGAARRGLSDAAKQAAVVAATRHRKATD